MVPFPTNKGVWVAFLLFFSCDGHVGEADEDPASCLQDQPVRRVFDADILHSGRSGLLEARIQCARQEEYANQNIVYPEGLTVRRYKQGRLFFFLRADSAYYVHDERAYKVYGGGTGEKPRERARDAYGVFGVGLEEKRNSHESAGFHPLGRRGPRKRGASCLGGF